MATAGIRCPACGGEFETQAALDAHTRQEHQGQPTGGFRCPACGGEFETQAALDAHIGQEHRR